MRKLFGIIVGIVVGLSLVATPAHAASDDFEFKSFTADYYLGRDSENRSTLRTVERLTANFPNPNQNHGIERAIPKSYDGHSVSLKIESVTNDQGVPVPYTTYSSNDNQVVRIGDKDIYVDGIQTYQLTYTQRDVTKNFTSVDEFYWDTNGTEWRQPFESVRATVHIDSAIAGALDGNTSCYRGLSGSKTSCTISQSGSTLQASESNLGPGENVTFAIGFKAGTFAVYQQTLAERLLGMWLISMVVTGIIGVLALFWIGMRYSQRSNRTNEIGAIVPEYIPPKNASILLSEQMSDGTRAAMTAQIIDLSVRHYFKLYQTQGKSLLKSAEYELEIVKSIDDLRKEERQFVTTLFGAASTAVGSRFEMKKLKSDYKVAAQLRKDTKALSELVKGEYELRHADVRQSRWFTRTGWITLGFGVITLSPALLIAGIVSLVCATQLRPLTDAGLDLRRYLAGLKLYIGVAEEERLKLLQSPEGAEKTGVKSPDNTKQLVRLYERVLPYAVLFGQEKEWNKQLGQYYEQNGSQPDWYSGHTAFNAALFAS
ncbi:DUF2207 domain-containing protein, partial [Candidatus Saccharibacteria bacterium]|nr:DUF2207 domain-containing protein [Candidatus Saccharibacteria bacterium]